MRNFATHLIVAAGLLLAVLGYAVGSNWGTFVLMYDNMTAMNEGGQMAQEMKHPKDVLEYVATHPEDASLVAYTVGSRDQGIFFQDDVQRPVVSATHLLLLAEYSWRVEQNKLDPDRRVDLDSLRVYSLPGSGQENHEQVLARWREENHVRDDSTVALRYVINAIARFGDTAAADWFMMTLGRTRVEELPAKWGLSNSEQPLPESGLYLDWSSHAQTAPVSTKLRSYRAMSRKSRADSVYRLVGALRRDASFRQDKRERLSQRGTSLSIRDQRALAEASYPTGTAADYADFLGHILQDTLRSPRVSRFVKDRIETPVSGDSLQTSIAAVGTQVGALPGIITFLSYVRYADNRPPRVVCLFLEELPLGVFYHLVQTGLDKGFQLQLLSNPDFFRQARERLSDRVPEEDAF